MVTRRAPAQDGFTLTELMVALAVLLIGFIGVLQLSGTGLRATGFARSAGEATTLAQDKMEALRTQPALAAPGTELVDALGAVRTDGSYLRSWTSSALPDGTTQIHVWVSWNDGGDEPHSIDFWTVR